ncbi:hypothetical protein F4802DRAFT_252251 [Xylaria palmicola]|nr:hypothetical protein F4802DRAFT_252251 [Xylaria palmicola]
MAEEVERLVLSQFREIVEKGKTAIENVESAGDQAPAPMLKAAQNLVKEGEKALKKIEPVSTANYEEYGSNLVNAIKENDDIAQFRSELEDLLWDFDDYIEVNEFDADKFTELQRASRNAALKMLDILKRMKLVAPAPAIISRPASEVGPSTNGRLSGLIGTEAGAEASLWSDTGAVRPPQPRNDLDASSRRSGPSDPPSEPPPTPPSTNPWQVGRVPMSTLGVHLEEGDDFERRAPVAPDSPTIPKTQLVSSDDALSFPESRGVDDSAMNEEHENRMRAASQSHTSHSEGSLSPSQNHRWTTSTQDSTESMRSPTRSQGGFIRSNGNSALHPHGHEHSISGVSSGTSLAVGNSSSRPNSRAVGTYSRDRENSFANNTGFPPRTTSVANQNSTSYILSSRRPSTESINSSVFDVVESLSPTDPRASSGYQHPMQASTPASQRTTGFPPLGYPGPPPLYQTPTVPPRRTSGITIRSQSSGGRTAHPGNVLMRMDEGLIPVDVDTAGSNEVPIPPREPDCTITSSSSFYKLKGFCKGAEEALRGQLGFKRIKRPVGAFSTSIVAKCTHCLFELDFKSVEQDLNNDSGSFTSNTVGFRLRVLQKSHLPIRVIEEQIYGCLFCIQAGHTLEESDSTVFFNQKQLFAHLTRHPRPLPKITGVTVIEESELPPQVKDNFDLHFPHPPIQSVMIGIAREVSRLPTATTTETRKVSHGSMRLPPDRQAAPLHFAVGAKIVGIEFPAKYEGRWAIGWHDGVRAAFEADAVQIEAPPKAEVKMQGTSSVQAVARWKWSQKGDDRWLKFDKGDVIKNISCEFSLRDYLVLRDDKLDFSNLLANIGVYNDHWCWSGTTSKGFGIFPQSHLDPDSIRTVNSEDAGSVSSWEKKNPLKFSLRGKKEDRKPGSFSSQENSTWRSNVY